MTHGNGTECRVTCHPDGIRVSWKGGHADMPGTIDESVRDTIDRYCEQNPGLKEIIDGGHLRISEVFHDDLLFGEPRVWSGDGWEASYDWSPDTGGRMAIVMHGPEGDRIMTVPAGYMDVHLLDDGHDPLREQWEDGGGVCYDNGLPWVDGRVLEWAVEVVDTDIDDVSRREYRGDETEARDAAQEMWDEIDPVDKLNHCVRYGRVPSCSDDLDEYETIAIEWRHPGDVPWSEVREYLQGLFDGESPADLVSRTGGDVDRAVNAWVQWHYGRGHGSCGNMAKHNRAALALELGLSPMDLKSLVARYMVENPGDAVTCTKAVTAQGNSLVVPITREAKILGIGKGDRVEIVLRKI